MYHVLYFTTKYYPLDSVQQTSYHSLDRGWKIPSRNKLTAFPHVPSQYLVLSTPKPCTRHLNYNEVLCTDSSGGYKVSHRRNADLSNHTYRRSLHPNMPSRHRGIGGVMHCCPAQPPSHPTLYMCPRRKLPTSGSKIL